MSSAILTTDDASVSVTSVRAAALADRLIDGARSLAAFAATLTPEEWQMRVPRDGRKIGVTVHHVASMYPIEIQLAQLLASGKPVGSVTWGVVAEINAGHAKEFDALTKQG